MKLSFKNVISEKRQKRDRYKIVPEKYLGKVPKYLDTLGIFFILPKYLPFRSLLLGRLKSEIFHFLCTSKVDAQE